MHEKQMDVSTTTQIAINDESNVISLISETIGQTTVPILNGLKIVYILVYIFVATKHTVDEYHKTIQSCPDLWLKSGLTESKSHLSLVSKLSVVLRMLNEMP